MNGTNQLKQFQMIPWDSEGKEQWRIVALDSSGTLWTSTTNFADYSSDWVLM